MIWLVCFIPFALSAVAQQLLRRLTLRCSVISFNGSPLRCPGRGM